MSFSIIEELARTNPKKRVKQILEMHQRNLRFLRTVNTDLANAVATIGSGGFSIQVTDDFLDILHDATGHHIHPPGDAKHYFEDLGRPHHDQWIDLMDVGHTYWGEIEHGQRLVQFLEPLHEAIPELPQRLAKGVVSVPKMKDGRRFSGVVLFLGVFSGLHIAHFLNRNEVRNIVLVEPDLERFALSTFFLDYSAIERRFGKVMLHVGPDMPTNLPELLIGACPVSALAWVRILQAYPSDDFEELIGAFKLRWRQLIEVVVPFDREVRNLGYGAQNIKEKRPIWAKKPELSDGAQIAVVASGPSLTADLSWLKDNQDRLIIFAAHSAVRVLMANGIRPDFQFNLETELDEDVLKKLKLDPTIPMVGYYKASASLLSNCDTNLLVVETNKANPVEWRSAFTGTHPTTGNIAFCTAVECRPQKLYILGLDLSYRDLKETHVKGSWYDDDDGKGHRVFEARERVPAKANFEESEGLVTTTAYHQIARNNIEGVLRRSKVSIQVFNLSDGVHIEGAAPKHSGDVKLPDYPEKAADVAAIVDAFQPGGGDNWQPYKLSGKDRWKKFQESLFEKLGENWGDWAKFAVALDQAWDYAFIMSIRDQPSDIRMEAYHMLIQHALADWLRVLLFTSDRSEAQNIFNIGMESLRKVLGEVKYPEEIDQEFNPVTEIVSADSTTALTAPTEPQTDIQDRETIQ